MPKFNIGVQFGIGDDGEFEGFNIAFGMSDFTSPQLSSSKKRPKKKPKNDPAIETIQYLLGEILEDD